MLEFAVSMRVGEGRNIKFGNDRWIGASCFKDKFPHLFLISLQREDNVANMGFLDMIQWHWNLIWRTIISMGNSTDEEETINHLFLHCKHTWRVWTECMKWWKVQMPISQFPEQWYLKVIFKEISGSHSSLW